MDYQDDRQILVGKRPDEVKVGMDGLSQGTRDQLFLALRVAAIEEHLREREAVPIAIDDLLVQFDDDRAVATLGCWPNWPAARRCCFSPITAISASWRPPRCRRTPGGTI